MHLYRLSFAAHMHVAVLQIIYTHACMYSQHNRVIHIRVHGFPLANSQAITRKFRREFFSVDLFGAKMGVASKIISKVVTKKWL